MRDFDSNRRASSKRSASPFGWLVALLGVLVLVASYRLEPDTAVGAVSLSLRAVAWVVIAVGLLMVLFMQRRGARRDKPPRVEPSHDMEDDDAQAGMTRPSVLAALGVGRAPTVAEPAFVDTIAVMPPTPTDDDETQAWDAEPASSEPSPPRFSPLLLQHLDNTRFVSLCRSFFSQAGFATSVAEDAQQSQQPPRGADLWVQSRHMPAPRIVRCRQWPDSAVDAREMREFLRAMSAQGLQHGTYVTSSTFTAEAVNFAKINGIQVQDGAAMLRLISHRSAQEQRDLLAIALGQGAQNAAPAP